MGENLFAEIFDNLFRFHSFERFGRNSNTELILHPETGGLKTVIRIETVGDARKIDAVDVVGGFLDQILGDLVSADFLELVIAQTGPPVSVGELGEGLPVPLVFRNVEGKVFFYGIENLRFGHTAGVIASVFHSLVEGHRTELTLIEFVMELFRGVYRQSGRTVESEIVYGAWSIISSMNLRVLPSSRIRWRYE